VEHLLHRLYGVDAPEHIAPTFSIQSIVLSKMQQNGVDLLISAFDFRLWTLFVINEYYAAIPYKIEN